MSAEAALTGGDQDIAESLRAGLRFRSAADIKRFAAGFDPQPMHPDEATAAQTLQGALQHQGESLERVKGIEPSYSAWKGFGS
ncbi:acyl dehydratase [Bradyrhizobium elkanii]